nr:hypothetical protein [Tanacetum cinerariifolium]
MAPLTFADTHNMVTYLSKSDASVGFDQICISAKRTAWNEFSYSMASAVICLATETCAKFSQKFTKLEQDKHTQALEIIKLKKRVKKFENKKNSRSSILKRLRKVGAIDANEDITLVDVDTQVEMDAELQGRINQDVAAATKDVSAAEPTVFDDEEVTISMAQTLIKIKVEKEKKILDEQIAKRLHDEEVKKATTKEKQEKDDLERAQVLQQQYDDKEETIDWNIVVEQIQEKDLDNIKKYQSMTYDKVRPIFEREYKKVQTLFKLDKDVEEPTKKRVAEETLLQESFKKQKAVEASSSNSTQETPSIDPKKINWEIYYEGSRSYWKIIRVGGITEAYQIFEDMLKGFDREDLVALWNLVKEKFSLAVPNVDKEKDLWVELKRLFEPDENDVLWKLQRYMHYPITWKLYSNF